MDIHNKRALKHDFQARTLSSLACHGPLVLEEAAAEDCSAEAVPS